MMSLVEPTTEELNLLIAEAARIAKECREYREWYETLQRDLLGGVLYDACCGEEPEGLESIDRIVESPPVPKCEVCGGGVAKITHVEEIKWSRYEHWWDRWWAWLKREQPSGLPFQVVTEWCALGHMVSQYEYCGFDREPTNWFETYGYCGGPPSVRCLGTSKEEHGVEPAGWRGLDEAANFHCQ